MKLITTDGYIEGTPAEIAEYVKLQKGKPGKGKDPVREWPRPGSDKDRIRCADPSRTRRANGGKSFKASVKPGATPNE